MKEPKLNLIYMTLLQTMSVWPSNTFNSSKRIPLEKSCKHIKSDNTWVLTQNHKDKKPSIFFFQKRALKMDINKNSKWQVTKHGASEKKYIIKGIMKLLSKFILSKCILSLKYQPLLCVRKGWRFTWRGMLRLLE